MRLTPIQASRRVSIITVVRNDATGLERTMNSVAAQDFADREYIIVDGASSDGTVEVIRRRAAEVTRWISQPDTGIYQAMNKGVRLATGEYICFMNAGDRFASTDTLAAMLVPRPRTELLWGDCIVESSHGEDYDEARNVLGRLHLQMTVSHQSLFVRRKVLAARPFDETLRLAADYDFLCERLLAGADWEYRPVPVSRIRETGATARLFVTAIREKRRIAGLRFPSRRHRIWAHYVALEGYMRLKRLLRRHPRY
jgi:glycosyltransferase involved in cell wall biosynthesis